MGTGHDHHHEGAPTGTPTGAEIHVGEIDAEQLRQIIADAPQPTRLRRRLFWAIVVGILTTGATAASIIGQGVSYRQMRAIESISDALTKGSCAR